MSGTSNKVEELYIQSHREACDLLVHIEVLLHDLPAPENDEVPIDWSHVGTVREVVARLNGVIAYLSGIEK